MFGEANCNKLTYFSRHICKRTQRRRGWVGRAPLASEILKIFGNFKTLYQLRMYVMMSCDLNIRVRRKNIKLCPQLNPYPRRP